ncbi:MAG: TatD family hydrolase [Slackia sp.]|nr:TatD family hydrolase [Slackia sp.]
MLYDMHCHLDFSDEGVAASSAMHDRIAAFSATVDPRDYDRVRTLFDDATAVRIGLGLHPWQASSPDFAAQVDLFADRVSGCAFIGEVGLDFSVKHMSTRDLQMEAFDRVVRACVENPVSENREAPSRGIVSIHAVRAVDEVIDAFERAGVICAGCATQPAYAGDRALVFHSFAGTSDQLQRAIKAGFFFSAGPRMLATKRGRAYVRAIPVTRLLLETDMPCAAGAAFSARSWESALEKTLEDICQACGRDVGEMRDILAETSARLLGL